MSPTISRKSSFTSTFPSTSPSPSYSPSPSSTFDTQPHTLPPRSRTSSTTSLTSIKHPLNPHPYAIKTTSSAVTSSSSPAHHQASYKHYVPPPSPSPTGEAPAGWRSRAGSFSSSAGGVYPTNGGGGGGGGGSQGHRYSRSMTDAGPRALPIPPSMDRSASTSPTTGRTRSAFVEMEADAGYFGDVGSGSRGTMKSMNAASSRDNRDKGRTPRQSAIGGAPGMRRADTLPFEHSNSPFVFPVPHPSRTRAEALSFSSDEEDEDHEHELASNASHGTTKFAPVRRTTGSRVRGMVASFERSASSSSGSELDNDDYRGSTTKATYTPGSPTKLGYNSNPNSPVKKTVPNRRSVADLFSSGSPAPAPVSNYAASQYATSIPTTLSPGGGSDDLVHATLKPTLPTRRTTSKELPRLLPFPPPIAQTSPSSFCNPASPAVLGAPLGYYPASPVVPVNGSPAGVIVPVHTGAGYALPVSPEHTGGCGGGRLLPVPPDLVPSPPQGQARENDERGEREGTLHHPRPVRGGPPELVQVDLGRGESEGGEEEEEEELSMEELLAREDAAAASISADELGVRGFGNGVGHNTNGTGSASGIVKSKGKGVSAWEVGEVGETVKRVPGGPRPLSSNHTSNHGGRLSVGKRNSLHAVDGINKEVAAAHSKAELGSPTSPTIAFGEVEKRGTGFVSGRRKARVRPKGSRSSLDSVGSIGDKERRYEEAQVQTDLESSPPPVDGSEGTQHNDADLEGKGREFDLEEKAKTLDAREMELASLALEIEDTRRELESVRTEVEAKRAEVDARAESVGVREVVVEAKVRALEDRESAFGGREDGLKAKARAIEEREDDLREKEERVKEREERVESRERELEVRAEGLKMSLEERAREVEGREVELVRREEELARREAVLDDREMRLKVKEDEMKTKEGEMKAREDELKTREEDLGQRETAVGVATRLVRSVVKRFASASSSSPSASPATTTSSSSITSSTSATTKTPSADKDKSAPLLRRSTYPYMVVLGLGVCVVVRVLVKGLGGRGGALGRK